MRLGWYDLFLGILESRASFSMYALTSFPLGSSVEERIKSTVLVKRGTLLLHPQGALPSPEISVESGHPYIVQDRQMWRGPQLIPPS